MPVRQQLAWMFSDQLKPDAKVIEMGGPPLSERRPINRPFRWRLVVGIAVLVTCGAIGYIIGDRHSPGDLPRVGRSEASALSAVARTRRPAGRMQGR